MSTLRGEAQIRRLDCVLEPTKQAVLDRYKQLAGRIENLEPVLQAVAGQQFYNTSRLTFTKLLDDPDTIADSLQLYIGGHYIYVTQDMKRRGGE